MTDIAAPDGASFDPRQVVVLRAGRVRYHDQDHHGNQVRLRKRLAQGHLVILPAYLADQLGAGDDPRVRPAMAHESVQDVHARVYPNAPGAGGAGEGRG
jgi:hypothetical protein